MPYRLLSRLALCLCFVLSVSCTRVDLAYRNLDVIVPWTLNDYLDMNRDQKSWFKQRLGEHLRWHCSTQLPAYLQWVQNLQQDIAANRLDDARLQALGNQAEQAIQQVAVEITPSAVQLLQGLDDNQVRAMGQAFDEDIQKHRDELVQLPLDQQVSERSERMEKRLKPWLGSLNEGQRQRIAAWSRSLGEQNRLWIDNREQWQKQMLAAVQQRHAADFPERIARLLQHRQQFWTPEYAQVAPRTEAAGRSLMLGVLADSTPPQRALLQTRLNDLRDDFSQLACMKNGNT